MTLVQNTDVQLGYNKCDLISEIIVIKKGTKLDYMTETHQCWFKFRSICISWVNTPSAGL